MNDVQFNGIQFDPVEHRYTYNGKEFISTTTLLKQYGLSVNYSAVPPDVLAKAAQRGNAVHKGLELFIGGDKSMLGLLNEVDLFNNYITKHGIDLTTAKSEEIIFNTKYGVAGTVDFQYNHLGTNIIADFKTTYNLNADAVAWQLSVYNYILSKGDVLMYYFNELKAYHFTQGRLEVVDIRRIEFEAVEGLLKAYLNNDPMYVYTPDLSKIISSSEHQFLEYALEEIDMYKQYIKQLNSKVSVILDKIKNRMVVKGYTNVNIDNLSLVYRKGYERVSIDQKAIEQYLQTQGSNIQNYAKKTTVKDSIIAKLHQPPDVAPDMFDHLDVPVIEKSDTE